ncbi:MAG: hypothetical protein C5B59_03775 [Bacteroidetes bacterium]|nr:MAG: hypothetical protein C5B59_03775 [Bacteroidota bacterium]
MDSLREWLMPYLLSNLLAILCVIAAWKKPMWARIFLAAFFLWAAFINSRFAWLNPKVYLNYAQLTGFSLYKNFILGYFSNHISPFVFTIAAGQFLIFLGLILNNGLTRTACIGGIIFGLAIAPLGVGSGFPTTVLMAIAFYILLNKYPEHDFIWNLTQYTDSVSGKVAK